MPKRTDIRRILIVGSGAIVIGQAWEVWFLRQGTASAVPTQSREESGFSR